MTKKRNIIIGLVFMSASLVMGAEAQNSAASAFPNYRHARQFARLKETQCGPLALIAIMQRMGYGLSAQDIDSILNNSDRAGISMLDL